MDISISLIILAAGSSTRLGQPKQLLRDENGQTFIRRTIETALATPFRPIICVLGANFEQIYEEIKHFEIKIVKNENWSLGMSGSIKTGIEQIVEDKTINAAIMMLCDQPEISVNHLEKLVSSYQTKKFSGAASVYQGIKGVPALFDRRHFNDLLNLKGDQGARKIIENLGANAAGIEFQAGASDIDTVEDYQNYLSKQQAFDNPITDKIHS